MDRKDITIILVSYFSFLHLKRIAKIFDKNNIIIIENSKDLKVKTYFKNRKNINVIFPKKNLGYGAGNNLGIKLSKSPYCLILNPDTLFKYKDFKKLEKYITEIYDFGLLLPRLKNSKSINAFNDTNDKIIKANYKFIGLDYASGCAMLINKKKFKKNCIFDPKIFLYKEETDLIKRCEFKNINCFLLKDITVKHFGTSSIKNKKISSVESEKFRNWHWMWSNFYFYKKHYGLTYSLIKFSRSFISAIIKLSFYSLSNNQKFEIYWARFNGLLCSMLNKNSNYRINYKNKL